MKRQLAPLPTPLLASLPAYLSVSLAAELAGAHRAVTVHGGVQTVWHLWGQASQPVVVLLHGGSGLGCSCDLTPHTLHQRTGEMTRDVKQAQAQV